MEKKWLKGILSDSNYDLSIFENSEVIAIEEKIIEKKGKPCALCKEKI
jgi:hypothetical protein